MRTEASAFQKPLEAALENALVYLESLDRASVAATVDLVTLRNRIGKALVVPKLRTPLVNPSRCTDRVDK